MDSHIEMNGDFSITRHMGEHFSGCFCCIPTTAQETMV